MIEERKPKMILNATIDSGRRRGRPRKWWIDDLESDLRSLGWNWKAKSRNRNEWKTVVREAKVHFTGLWSHIRWWWWWWCIFQFLGPILKLLYSENILTIKLLIIIIIIIIYMPLQSSKMDLGLSHNCLPFISVCSFNLPVSYV